MTRQITDRELLELAAKAAGYVYSSEYGVVFSDEYPQGSEWNPLEDDGDALRLAVALRIHVSPTPAYIEARYFDGAAWQCFKEPANTVPFACRAIVRAAAEIGRDMK